MSFCLLGMVGLWRIRILILLWCIVGWLRFDNLRMIFWQNTIIPPCKLTYPPKDALLSRWFSFSPGEIYEFLGGYSQNQFTSGTKALAPDCYCFCTTQLGCSWTTPSFSCFWLVSYICPWTSFAPKRLTPICHINGLLLTRFSWVHAVAPARNARTEIAPEKAAGFCREGVRCFFFSRWPPQNVTWHINSFKYLHKVARCCDFAMTWVLGFFFGNNVNVGELGSWDENHIFLIYLGSCTFFMCPQEWLTPPYHWNIIGI